jgi:hypothetical protein
MGVTARVSGGADDQCLSWRLIHSLLFNSLIILECS